MHRRVWVTREEAPDGPLSSSLLKVGLTPVLEPVIQRRVVADIGPMLDALGRDDWLVLTSVFAIRAIDAARVRCRLAVVGESSRLAALERGLSVSLVSPEASGESLWSEVRARAAPGVRVLYPRSSQAPPVRCAGLQIETPILYETAARPFDQTVVRRCAVVAVASPSAAAALAAVPDLPLVASIGPTTSRALRRCGIEPWSEAPEQSFSALAREIASSLAEPLRC